MRYSIQLQLLAFGLFVLAGCKKEKVVTLETASLNVTNLAVNAGATKINYFGTPIKWATYTQNANTTNTAAMVVAPSTLNFATQGKYTINVGSNPIVIVPTSDTLTPIYSGSVQTSAGDIHSLYLIGQSPTYESILMKESIPASTFPDSSINIRFINLSPNSPAVNITLAATTTVNEAAGLNYKQITDFKKYLVPTVIPAGSVTFQVRNATTNAILTTYTLPAAGAAPNPTVGIALSRFKSITLAIKGLAGTTTGTNAYSVLPIANY